MNILGAGLGMICYSWALHERKNVSPKGLMFGSYNNTVQFRAKLLAILLMLEKGKVTCHLRLLMI